MPKVYYVYIICRYYSDFNNSIHIIIICKTIILLYCIFVLSALLPYVAAVVPTTTFKTIIFIFFKLFILFLSRFLCLGLLCYWCTSIIDILTKLICLWRQLTIHAVHDDNVDQIVFYFYNIINYHIIHIVGLFLAVRLVRRPACMKDNTDALIVNPFFSINYNSDIMLDYFTHNLW